MGGANIGLPSAKACIYHAHGQPPDHQHQIIKVYSNKKKGKLKPNSRKAID